MKQSLVFLLKPQVMLQAIEMCDFSGQNKHHRPRYEIFQNPKSINVTERKLCGI